MKKFIQWMIPSIIGSALTIVVFTAVYKPHQYENKTTQAQTTYPVQKALYTVKENGEFVPLDFTGVSNHVMNSVVHIKSTRTIEPSSPQYYGNSNPLGEMFGEDFFKYFWGEPRGRQFQQRQAEPMVQVGTGSGVIINDKGYIVTNNHVVEGADEIEVTLHNNDTYKARVIGTDPSTDVALLRIKKEGLTPVPLGNSDLVEVGEWVMAIGNPFNLNSTVTAGIISAKGRNINIIDDQSAIEAFIQTDAAINPGNSGGALVNLKGELIGINTAIASPTGAYAGYGFAIPSDIVQKVVNDLMKYGAVQRAYLGIMIRDIGKDIIDSENLKTTEGAYVDSLYEGSAAEKAGMKAGDVIVEVDQSPVKKTADLLEQIGRHHPGDQVEVKVDRKGKTEIFTVKLADAKGMQELVAAGEQDVMDMLGARFEELDHKTSKELGIEGGVRVKKLGNGILKNQTDIKEGFIITGINNQPVTSLDQLGKALSEHEGGVLVQGIYENFPGEIYYAFGLPED